MATKTIGLSGRDYSTVAAWASYVNALTLTGPEVGEVYNDGGPVTDTVAVSITGYSGANSTNTVTLKAAAGQSFRDNPTNALRYNSANGASLVTSANSAIGYTVGPYFIFDGLMITNSSGGTYVISIGNNSTIQNCIVRSVTSGFPVIQTNSNPNVNIYNCIVHHTNGGLGINTTANGLVVTNSLIIATGPTGSFGFRQQYSSGVPPLVKNTAVFGFTTDFQNTSSSLCAANATDKATFGGTNWGSNGGQTSITSSEWISVTTGSEDFRLSNSSTKLKDLGVTTTLITDIVGTTRPQGAAYDIGPWELAGGASLASNIATTVTTSSNLSTQVLLAGNLAVTSSITAVFNNNLLAANVSSIAVVQGNLTTSIRFASNLVNVSVLSASLDNNLIGFNTPPLKNNTGQLLANETNVVVNVYNSTTGALVIRKTGLASDSFGVVQVRDLALSAGVTYSYEVVLQTNGRRLPTATAS